MRILFVSERFPFPLHDGGNLRTFHLLKGLADEHQVTLVAHHGSETESRDEASVSDFCRVVTVKRPSRVATLARIAVRGGLFSESLFTAKNWSPLLLKTIDRLLRDESFDAIHFNHLDTAYYALRKHWPQLKVFDTHNCLSVMAGQLCRESASRSRRIVASLEAKRLRIAEANVCKRMDAVLACSDEEAAQFRTLASIDNVTTIPNGVDCDYFHPTKGHGIEPGAMVFVGSMGYYPNHDAAIYLCRDILPKLQDLSPAPKVYIVGKDPPNSLVALNNGKNVVITGRVDDVRPYLERAMVVIVPLRHGAGTRLKILEAFAMGRPVVSTTKGAEGIPAVDGTQILLASDTDDLVSQLRKVWSSKELRETLGTAGRQLAKEQFDWSAIGDQVRDVYRRVAGARLESVAS